LTQRVTHSLVKALRAVPDFASLDDHTLLGIVGASVNLFWPAGSLVFEKGSPSEALFVVLSGEIRILDTVDGKVQEVSRLGPGESFGELSLLLQTTHTKNAEAVQDSELMVLPEESFQELLDSNEELSAHFRRRVEERGPVRGEISETS
jgi:thioredoxin reductase (NADPH)